MTAVLALIAGLILASAAFALTRRNLVHSALLLVLTWMGVAGFYLWAGAEFVAFAQILIYVGAISMVVLFAVLLTRTTGTNEPIGPDSLKRASAAIAVAGTVGTVLVAAVLKSPFGPVREAAPTVTVKEIGQQLMGTHAASLLVVGIILTVALLGATLIASTDRPDRGGDAS